MNVRQLLSALDRANARVRQALTNTLASAPAIVELAETDPVGADARMKQLEAASTEVIENSARHIEPLARRFLGESRNAGEAPLDFIQRISAKVMQLHPAAFNDSVAKLRGIAGEAKRLARGRPSC